MAVGNAELSVATICTGPAVVVLWIVAVYVPSPLSAVLPTSFVNVTPVSPGTGTPALLTLAMAVAVELPSAMIGFGESDVMVMLVAKPA
jgi:hypothetical protein